MDQSNASFKSSLDNIISNTHWIIWADETPILDLSQINEFNHET